MLLNEHTRRKCRGVVTRQDRHFGLAQHFAVIQFLGHDMDRAARRRIARRNGALMRVEPL